MTPSDSRQSSSHYEAAVRLQNRVLELVRERDELLECKSCGGDGRAEL